MVCSPTVLLVPVLRPDDSQHHPLFPHSGMYLVMFLEHIEIMFNKERQRVMGTSLCLMLVTSALFVLVTLVC